MKMLCSELVKMVLRVKQESGWQQGKQYFHELQG